MLQSHSLVGRPVPSTAHARKALALRHRRSGGRTTGGSHQQIVCVAAPDAKTSASGNGTVKSAPAFLAWAETAASKKREDLKKIMVIGAGPIVIGQVRVALGMALSIGGVVGGWLSMARVASRCVDVLHRRANLTTRGRKHAKPSSMLCCALCTLLDHY